MNEALRKQIKESKNLHLGMKADPAAGQYAVWQNKKVTDRKVIASFESMEGITHTGRGEVSISEEMKYNGHATLCLTRDQRDKMESMKFSFTDWPDHTALIELSAGGADLTGYNRMSMWVYADSPTRPNVWIYCVLCNRDHGSIDRDGLDSRTGFNVPTNQWVQVFWEFGHHEREAVRCFTLANQPEGVNPGDDPRLKIYFADFAVEQVEADYVAGWDLGERIAYNQTGFLPDGPKSAATQGADGEVYCLKDAKSGEVAYTGSCETISNDMGTYQVMDFSEFAKEGTYVLEVAGRCTHPFEIRRDVLESPLWKLLNFFERERCGVEVQGTHGVCGMTDYMIHPENGKMFLNAGSWHDAGDLCTELTTTSDAIIAMLDLMTSLKDRAAGEGAEAEDAAALYDRTEEEVRHGLDWVQRATFRDGYYAFMSGHMNWDGYIYEKPAHIGHFGQPVKMALGHWFRAGVLGQAYHVFKDSDAWYARLSLVEAKEDYAFGLEAEKEELAKGPYDDRIGNTASHMLQHMSRKGYAALQLYLATNEQCYLDDAAACAKIVMECQQTAMPDWDRPIRGFFYNEPEKLNIAQYEHQSAEQAPIVFLARLYEALPEHADAPYWRNACELYREYILATADDVAPYGLLPAAIYNTDMKIREQFKMMEGEELITKYIRESIENGIPLGGGHYLRRMPVSSTLLKGFFAPVYAKAWAVAEIARALDDEKLREIGLKQLGWIFGMNPFARSDMYGEGYGWQPLYTPYSPDMVGAVPVGIQSDGSKDAPLYPDDNRPTYNEVWIHSASRLFGTLANLI